MTEPKHQLTKPPIVEAIVDIDCDLPTGQRYEDLESPARDRFIDRYPKCKRQYIHQHQVEAKPDGVSNVSFSQEIQAFQFFQEDEKQLVQLRRQGFAFNRLEPYTSLDDYLKEIERTWKLYKEMTSPVSVRVIRLRYVNRILLPSNSEQVDLDEYLRIGPRSPDEGRLSLVGFLCQQSSIEKGTGNQVELVLTAQLPTGDRLPIILDLCVSSIESGDPDDWTWISDKIQVLRKLKNRIFERTVTEKCMNLFQPS